jgi:hypothetical protein
MPREKSSTAVPTNEPATRFRGGGRKGKTRMSKATPAAESKAVNTVDEFARRFSNLTELQAACLSEACAAFKLEPKDISDHKFYGGDHGVLGVVVVTTGGRKLRYPIDELTGRTLADMEFEREELAVRTQIVDQNRELLVLEGRLADIQRARHNARV